MMKILFLLLLASFFIAGCGGNDQEVKPDRQSALIYLGGAGGNRIIFFNTDKFPNLAIFRKRESDSAYVVVKTLSITPVPLNARVGDHGPGYAYNWNDPEDNSVKTRYKLSALDESLNILMELKNIYAVPADNGEWKYIER